jgi:hypothetical protein
LIALPTTSPVDPVDWESANRSVLWGWKRDRCVESRTVYFSGDLARAEDGAGLGRAYLQYRHRTTAAEAAEALFLQLVEGRDALAPLGIEASVRLHRRNGTRSLEADFGVPLPADIELSGRLRRRRPRLRIQEPTLPDDADPTLLHALSRFDLYVGSGVSYEAGLPTLCDMHQIFGVDRADGTDFAFGFDDLLPGSLAADPIAVLTAFCSVHLGALCARPTRAQRVIACLHRLGIIGRVFTDNVDNLLAKTGVPFTRTRGSGVLNERCEVSFSSDVLVVVGVAADRRSVVKQARARGLSIIVVNPCMHVSPRVQHLNYLRPGDLFFRITADAFALHLQHAHAGRFVS